MIVCMITSQSSPSLDAPTLTNDDFTEGNLNRDSYIRPERLVAVDSGIVAYKIGHITEAKIQQVLYVVRRLFA